MAQEGEQVVVGPETETLGVDSEYRSDKMEFGKGKVPWTDLQSGEGSVNPEEAQRPWGCVGQDSLVQRR